MVDLLEKHPKRIKLCNLNEKIEKVLEQYQKIMYNAIFLYLMVCKHQGHGMKSCRHKSTSSVQKGFVQPSLKVNNVEQLKRDAYISLYCIPLWYRYQYLFSWLWLRLFRSLTHLYVILSKYIGVSFILNTLHVLLHASPCTAFLYNIDINTYSQTRG